MMKSTFSWRDQNNTSGPDQKYTSNEIKEENR